MRPPVRDPWLSSLPGSVGSDFCRPRGPRAGSVLGGVGRCAADAPRAHARYRTRLICFQQAMAVDFRSQNDNFSR